MKSSSWVKVSLLDLVQIWCEPASADAASYLENLAKNTDEGSDIKQDHFYADEIFFY